MLKLICHYTERFCLDFRIKITTGGFLSQNTGAFVKISDQLPNHPDTHVVSSYFARWGPGRCYPARRPCQTAAACIGRGTYTTTTLWPFCNRSMIGPGALGIAMTIAVC